MMMGCTMTIRVPTLTTLSSLATWTVCIEPILVSPCVLFHDLVLPVLTMIAHFTAQLVSKTTTKTTTNFDRLVSQVLARYSAAAKIALSACFAVDDHLYIHAIPATFVLALNHLSLSSDLCFPFEV